MPLSVQCKTCNRQFRAADDLAGKRIKCPQCQAVIAVSAVPPKIATAVAEAADTSSNLSGDSSSKKLVGSSAVAAAKSAARAAASAAPSVKAATSAKSVLKKAEPLKTAVPEAFDQWYMQGDDGVRFGPVPRRELDAWFSDGRIDQTCQLLRDGWEQWKWADEVYPQLAALSANLSAPLSSKSFDAMHGTTANGESVVGASAIVTGDELAQQGAATAKGLLSNTELTTRLRKTLGDARQWITFVAKLGFIVGGLATIGGLIVAAMGIAESNVALVLFGLMVSIGPAMMLPAAYFLLEYDRKLAAYLRKKQDRDLGAAMTAQGVFWKMTCILAAVAAGVYAVLFVLLYVLGKG